MNIKQALKSKTIQFAVLLAVLSVLQGYVGYLPASPAVQATVGCVLAACVTVLRIVTTQPLSDK